MTRLLGIVLAGLFALLGIAGAAHAVCAPYADVSNLSSPDPGLRLQYKHPVSPSPAVLDSRNYQQALLTAIGKISRLKSDVSGSALGALIHQGQLDRFRGFSSHICSYLDHAFSSSVRLHLLHCILRN